jgi:type I restriction enzyme M protein
VPTDCNWENLSTKRGDELEKHYIYTLRTLGQQKGMLGQIFTKSQNPSLLFKIIDMIDQESWVRMGADVKGDIKGNDRSSLSKMPRRRFELRTRGFSVLCSTN